MSKYYTGGSAVLFIEFGFFGKWVLFFPLSCSRSVPPGWAVSFLSAGTGEVGWQARVVSENEGEERDEERGGWTKRD